jgi:hypothetical protein
MLSGTCCGNDGGYGMLCRGSTPHRKTKCNEEGILQVVNRERDDSGVKPTCSSNNLKIHAALSPLHANTGPWPNLPRSCHHALRETSLFR